MSEAIHLMGLTAATLFGLALLCLAAGYVLEQIKGSRQAGLNSVIEKMRVRNHAIEMENDRLMALLAHDGPFGAIVKEGDRIRELLQSRCSPDMYVALEIALNQHVLEQVRASRLKKELVF